MKQLFANNAKTTLSSAILATGTALIVDDGSAFPNPNVFEYFLVTLEQGTSIEIVMITARAGNTMTIGGFLEVGETVAGRGQEGTISKAFSAGARVECRVTKATLGRMSVSLATIGSVNSILAPRDSYQEGYVANTLDPVGNPVIAIRKDDLTWRFLNYTSQITATSTASSTTTISATAIDIPDIISGKYLIQFTSGTHSGEIRVVTTCATNTVAWSGALSSPPGTGVTFEILKANSSIILDLVAINDESIIFPLIFSGD